MSTTTNNYNLVRNEQTDDTIQATVTDQNTTMNLIDSQMKVNDNKGNQALNPIEPSSIVSQLVNITTPTNDAKFILDIQTTVTGGNITINRNVSGAKDLLNPDGSNVIELLQDVRFYDVYEDGSDFILAPKGAKLIGDAIPADVLLGKTFSNVDDNDKVGTMPNNGGSNIASSYDDETIAEGYHNGLGKALAPTFSSGSTYTHVSVPTFGQFTVVYALANAFICKRKGSITVVITIYRNTTSGTVFGKIYKNGIPYGSEVSVNSNSPTEFTQSVSVSAGDSVELYTNAPSGNIVNSNLVGKASQQPEMY